MAQARRRLEHLRHSEPSPVAPPDLARLRKRLTSKLYNPLGIHLTADQEEELFESIRTDALRVQELEARIHEEKIRLAEPKFASGEYRLLDKGEDGWVRQTLRSSTDVIATVSRTVPVDGGRMAEVDLDLREHPELFALVGEKNWLATAVDRRIREFMIQLTEQALASGQGVRNR